MTLPEEINQYLQLGGLFNPELANHDAVRDLLIRCRDELQRHPLLWSEEKDMQYFRDNILSPSQEMVSIHEFGKPGVHVERGMLVREKTAQTATNKE